MVHLFTSFTYNDPCQLVKAGRAFNPKIQKISYTSSAGYACSPLGVLADLQSAVKKCPNLFMLWGYVIPSTQTVASISME